MAYYKTCPECGAALDPGEICDCKEKAAQDAANIQNGKSESEAARPTIKNILHERAGNCQA